jgi:hypothetical protein
MGFSNPSARGYAVSTMVSSQSTNREQVGGPAKAGLGRHIGMGQFVVAAIVNGAAGHAAPSVSGPNYPAAFRAFQRSGGRIGVNTLYPISTTNQLSNVGMGRHGSMFRTPADGVNAGQRAAATEMVRFFNGKGGNIAFTRGWVGPTLPPNPPGVAPGNFSWMQRSRN